MPFPLSASFSIVASLRLPVPTPSTDRNTPVVALLFDQPRELVQARDADVEVAVGREDDAVDAALDEVLVRDLVGELDAGGAVGRSAGAAERRSRPGSRRAVAARRRQHDAARARVDDDRDAILRGQRLGEHLHRGLAPAAAARAASIEPDTSSRNTRLRGGIFPRRCRLACRPMSASLCRLFHGHGASSVVIPNGAPCVESA